LNKKELFQFTGYCYQKEDECNLNEQKKLIRPLLRLFKGYRMLVLGDREFHSIKLANWLHGKGINFVLRQKQGTYIRQENQLLHTVTILGTNSWDLVLPDKYPSYQTERFR
jgi:hypothetical protein